MTIGLFVVLFGIAVGVTGVDYCDINCNGAKHTMCKYPPGGDAHCSEYEGGLTRKEKEFILSIHNQMRQRVARGQETRGPQPPASDMMELVWDEELAKIAQRWADQCDIKGHDQCRSSSDGTQVGQNIAYGRSWGFKPNRRDTLADSIKRWYDEVNSFSPSYIDVFRTDESFMKIGHYTQLVWATTTSVGCGLVDTTDQEGVYKYKLVCNYKPSGNFRGTPVYKRGKACSGCPAGTICSSRYPGLCTSW